MSRIRIQIRGSEQVQEYHPNKISSILAAHLLLMFCTLDDVEIIVRELS